jgi:hypothetical protein
MSSVGAFVAVVVAIIAAIFGFIWYPFKRLLRWLKRGKSAAEPKGEDPPDAP